MERVMFEAIKFDAANVNAAAQYAFGRCYLNGNGVRKGMKSAKAWFEKSAKRGCAEAEFKLGQLLQTSIGTPKRVKCGLRKPRNKAMRKYFSWIIC